MKTQKLVTATLDEICFPVRLLDEPMAANKNVSKMVVGLIDGGLRKLNQMSDVYELVPNREIFPEIENVFINAGISFTSTYKHIDHARFYADYTIEDGGLMSRVTGGIGDVIKPMLRVRHSYNGLTKYHISFGYYRMICSNGLVVPVEEMKEYNLSITGKHTNAINSSIQKLSATLDFFTRNFEKVNAQIVGKYDLLGGRVIANPAERVEAVLKANMINVVENSKFNTINAIIATIEKEANTVNLGYEGTVTDWLVYNGINQYLNDDSRNVMTPEVREDKDRKVFEHMLANPA